MNAMFEQRKGEDFVRSNIIPQTNADRIRAMSDEELAEFLAEYEVCTNCHYLENDCKFEGVCTKGFASAMAYEWLKSEVKE